MISDQSSDLGTKTDLVPQDDKSSKKQSRNQDN